MRRSILFICAAVMERHGKLGQDIAKNRSSKEPNSTVICVASGICTQEYAHLILWLVVKLIFLPRKNLCPALIVILGNPIHDKTITSAHSSASAGVDSDSASPGVSDHGRGSGCSSTAPALSGPVARTIYYIAAELVRLVGSVDSMKPVLQSLYHRVLLYPPPQHRVEAIKVMKEVGIH